MCWDEFREERATIPDAGGHCAGFGSSEIWRVELYGQPKSHGNTGLRPNCIPADQYCSAQLSFTDLQVDWGKIRARMRSTELSGGDFQMKKTA